MAGQGQQGNTTTATANFAWMLVLITFLMLLAWWFKRSIIVHVIFDFRMVEVYGMTLIFNALNDVLTSLDLTPLQEPYWYKWGQEIVFAHASVDFGKVPWSEVSHISRSVGRWLSYVFFACMAVMVYLLLFKHSSSRFSRVFSMKSLRESEASIWPAITPVVSTTLVEEDIDTGLWAMAQLPMTFSERHDLLSVKENARGEKIWTVQEDKCDAIFVKQLGSLWRGVHHAPEHIQALALIFVSKAERDTDLSKGLLEQLSISSATGQLDFSGVTEGLKKYENNRIMIWLSKRHAYTLTFMASLLDVCRSEGVMASSEFLWLKPHDRSLWYMLNSVGRQTAVVEAAGPYAHWVAEKKLKRALKTPMIKEAVAALSEAMLQILYVDKEESWRTSNED